MRVKFFHIVDGDRMYEEFDDVVDLTVYNDK